MIKMKYLLLAGMLPMAMIAQPVFAQESQNQTTQSSGDSTKWSARDMTYRGESYDVLDTNFITKKRMPQQKKFLNHQQAYPAKPRSLWEVGVGAGQYNVIGNIPSLMVWQKGGYGLDLQVRKSWGYMFSTRLQYMYGIAKGLSYQGTTNFANNPAWNGPNFGYYAPGNPQGNTATPIFNNYRMESHQLNLDFMINSNNIKFHHGHNSVSFYGYLGIGAFAYGTRVNALANDYTPYDFTTIVGNTAQTYKNKKTIRKALQSGMDNSYETPAATYSTKATLFNKTLDWCPSFGFGAEYKLNPRVNFQIEDRVSLPYKDDLLDGISTTGTDASAVTHNDMTNYFSIGVNFNLGNKKKNVQPLYWLNPLDFAYNELNYPRHMILPDPVLPDADGDGIADQFDKCPGTPAGIAVDSHGCPMDTDGDGVPDFRDKQLITPTECQPVDADGVGKCPCPEGCGTGATSCGSIGAGSVAFTANSAHFTQTMQVQLATLAAQMQANPTCKVVITGAGNGSKIQQQRSWDRVNAIIEYMSEKNGISRDRFIFQYGQAGDANVVMYRSAMAGEEGPANVAPPFPNLREPEKTDAPATPNK